MYNGFLSRTLKKERGYQQKTQITQEGLSYYFPTQPIKPNQERFSPESVRILEDRGGNNKQEYGRVRQINQRTHEKQEKGQ